MRVKWAYELSVSLQFGLISFIATTIAISTYQRDFNQALRTSDDIDPNSVSINIYEVAMGLWNNYYRWWLLAFVVLAIVRFGIVCLIGVVRARSVNVLR